MKKYLLLVAIFFAFNLLSANNVEKERAYILGKKFVETNFKQKNDSGLELAYTKMTESGEPCFYVFNVGEHGFVLVSAKDFARPILGYSENGKFDIDNIAPGLLFMIDVYKDAVEYAVDNDVAASPNIVSEWKALERCGMVKENNKAETIGPLCTTKWNQSWPYNKFCPVASWSSDEHVPVGCVATAIAQIMRYWAHPIQGNGSHSYRPWCSDCNSYCYSQQTVNFGATTYDWANMPDKINDDSPVEQIDAVATLSYHCGVALEMKYAHHDGNGSGAFSRRVPRATSSYFRYAPSECVDMYSYSDWIEKLTDNIYRRIPVYYSGCSESAGHAFVCDGLDKNGLFHFNYGWGGNSDGFYAPNAIEYGQSYVDAVFDMMPDYVYVNTAMAPSDLTVIPSDDNELTATLSWINPSMKIDSTDISHIDKVVVYRSGKIIYEETDVVPGSTSYFVDDEVPYYSYFDYSVCAIIDGAYGKISTVKNVFFGATCDWKLIVKTSDSEGMYGTYINVYDHNNVKFMSLRSTSSDTTTFEIPVPLGNVGFGWQTSEPQPHLYSINFVIKNSEDETVYEYTGNYAGLTSGGIFFRTSNTCGGVIDCEAPTNLDCTIEDGNFVLTWECADNPKYGFNIYRDDELIALSREKTFVDDDVPYGGHCYKVSAFCEYGMTENSNEICDVAVDNCDPPFELWCELTNTNRAKLHWESPLNENVSYYYIMRKNDEYAEWKRIKILKANKNEYTDNVMIGADGCYYYKVVAKYSDPECYSPPAKAKYSDEYFVKVCNSTDIVEADSHRVVVYPNPADDVVKLSVADGRLSVVKIYNIMGILLDEIEVSSNEIEIDVSDYNSGIYFLNIDGEVVKLIRN